MLHDDIMAMKANSIKNPAPADKARENRPVNLLLPQMKLLNSHGMTRAKMEMITSYDVLNEEISLLKQRMVQFKASHGGVNPINGMTCPSLY